jgi:anti-sigma-K factor RskA
MGERDGMTNEDLCREIESMIPAYALGALDSGEASFVDNHLDGCPDCRQLADQHKAIAEALLELPSPQAPPAYLRRRIVSRIKAEPVPAHTSAERRPGWSLPRLAFGLGLVALVVVNLLLLRRIDSLVEQQGALQAKVDRNQTAMAVLSYPTSKVVEVDGDSVFGTLVYDPARRLAVLYAWGLPDLPADQSYQAWLRDPSGGRVSAGLFQVEPGDQFSLLVLHSPSPIEQFAGLGVTVEPSGGSPGPTTAPILTADL